MAEWELWRERAEKLEERLEKIREDLERLREDVSIFESEIIARRDRFSIFVTPKAPFPLPPLPVMSPRWKYWSDISDRVYWLSSYLLSTSRELSKARTAATLLRGEFLEFPPGVKIKELFE